MKKTYILQGWKLDFTIHRKLIVKVAIDYCYNRSMAYCNGVNIWIQRVTIELIGIFLHGHPNQIWVLRTSKGEKTRTTIYFMVHFFLLFFLLCLILAFNSTYFPVSIIWNPFFIIFVWINWFFWPISSLRAKCKCPTQVIQICMLSQDQE